MDSSKDRERQAPRGPRTERSPSTEGSPHAEGSPRAERPPLTERPDPRAIAANVIERVLSDRAYGAAALSAALERYPQLDAKQRALTTELVYTTLRVQNSLTQQLAAHTKRGLPKDNAFLSHLLVAAAQILHLDHRRAPVAVDVAIVHIKALRGDKVAGFANAILRRVVAQQASFDREASLRESAPAWLRERLVAAVGSSESDLLLGVRTASDAPHAVTLRLRPTRPIPDWATSAPAGRFSPFARRSEGLGDPRRLAGYAEGDFVIQEEGAQLIALGVAATSGERILDACAGRGQKTTLLADAVAPTGHVCATDLHPKKLSALEAELTRLGLSGVTTAAVDWSRGSGDLTDLFDAALVDAPCTGTGTLRRRPEIMQRLTPGDPARLAALAIKILRQVALRVRPSGRVLYAVCSVLPEEAEGVVEAVRDLLEPEPFEAPAVIAALGQGARMGRLLPGQHGTDGYFLANFRRR